MPSLRAQLAHWLVYYKFYATRHATESQLLSNIQDSYTSEDVAKPAPSDVEGNEKLEVIRETKELAAGQEWTVDHISNKDGPESSKVLVYWHGGAFIRGVSPSSLPIFTTTHLTCVFPK